MARGRAKRVRIDGLDELAALIEGLTSQQAITLGALHDDLPDEVRIVTKAALVAGVAANDTVARTAKNFVYRPGRPALALFDYDMKGMPPGVTQQLTAAGGFWAALTSVLPALASTGHLLRLSTSAGLSRTDTGATFPGSGGLHGYVAIADGADAVRFLKDAARALLAQRLRLDECRCRRPVAGAFDHRPYGRRERNGWCSKDRRWSSRRCIRTRPRGGRRSSPGTCSTRSPPARR